MKRAALVMIPCLLGAAPPPGSWPLTPVGWGPAKIGMTRAQVSRALRVPLRGTAIESVDVCVEQSARSPAYAGVIFMFENQRLTRISTGGKSRVRTPSGIRVGATAAQVRRAYGRKLRVEPHHYLAKPAEYLTYWTVPATRGVRFETSEKRQVERIHAGTPSIQYVEGCA
jgi:hypothetical protein